MKRRIKKVSLEKILRKRFLRNKEYLVRDAEHDFIGNPITAELQCKGSSKGITYVSSQRFKLVDEREKVCLDEKGLPYFERTLGPITCRAYEEIFLGNTGFGTAMGHTNQRLLLKILRKTKKEKHSVYKEFKNYIGKLIKEAPKIKEALDETHFFDDGTGLANFSSLDLKIFEYLTSCFLSDYDPDNCDVDNIKLGQTHHKDFKTGKTKEEAAFIIWYRDYMENRDYEAKIEDPWNKSKKTLKEWVNKVSENLEANGFKKVEQFT